MSNGGLRSPVERAARSLAKRGLSSVVRELAPKHADLPLSLWGLERDGHGRLLQGGVVLSELLDRFGSPLHVVDGARLARNVAHFRATPPDAVRGCELYYSYKTNPVPGVLRAVHEAGAGADVASHYELWLALRLGVDPANIVFNGPEKSEQALRLAVSSGVGLVNLNSRSEIDRVVAVARELGARPAVGVRVVVPGTIGGQFGERIDDLSALATVADAMARPELRVVAIHTHVNAEIASVDLLQELVKGILKFVDKVRLELGLELEILDFGGNLGTPTVAPLSPRALRLATSFGCQPRARAPSTALCIDEYVSTLVSLVENHFAETHGKLPRIFLEPGRAVTGNAQMMLCRVASLREPDEAGMTWGVLDAGINVAEPLRNEVHQLFPLEKHHGPERLYRLMGPSCTLADQLYPAWHLPELEVGDALAIMDSGAYFVPFATCFSRPRPGIVMIERGATRLLRRAETFDDLAALDLGVGPQSPLR